MTDAELDSLMCKVLSDAIALDAESPREADILFRSSGRHNEQMRRMLKNPLGWAKKRDRTPLQNAGRWAAVILIFVSLSFGLVMLFSSTARAAVERWVVEWYQIHIVYRYFGKAENLPRYELTGLPNGFSELERMEEPTYTDVIYGNKSGELISFTYTVLKQGGATVFVPNGDTVSEVTIGKNPGMLFIPQDPENMTKLTWIDDKAGVQFTIVADLDELNMIRLAESLRREKS